MNKRLVPTGLKAAVSEVHDYDVIISSREIFLNGYGQEEDLGVDYRVATRFIKNLKILESFSSDPIVIHQYSEGGEWESGMAIYDAIQHSEASFIFICHGLAASMGSIIPQAVHRKGVRLTMPNCYWLIHEGEQSMEGTRKQVRSYYEFCELSKTQMYDIYSDVCYETGVHFQDTPKAKIKEFVKHKLESREDWWLTAEDALMYGFVDGIMGSKNYKSISEIQNHLV
jgi:ATP-dependent Clp protease protease subunit